MTLRVDLWPICACEHMYSHQSTENPENNMDTCMSSAGALRNSIYRDE